MTGGINIRGELGRPKEYFNCVLVCSKFITIFSSLPFEKFTGKALWLPINLPQQDFCITWCKKNTKITFYIEIA